MFGFEVSCAADPDSYVGGTCSVSTTVDTLVPGAIKEDHRAIWQLGQAKVYDGGDDSDGSTTAANTLFLDQGVFVP